MQMFKHSSKSSIQRRLYINHDEHMEQFFRHPRRSPGGVLPVSNTAPPSISIDQVCLFLTSDNCSHTVCTICALCIYYIMCLPSLDQHCVCHTCRVSVIYCFAVFHCD